MAINRGRCLFPFLSLVLLQPAPLRAMDRFAGVPAKVQPFVDKGEISGAVMLVADKDRVLHLSAVGESDLASGRRMRTDDLFWIASMSKPMTAVCVAILADQGMLSFDDPVEKFLPEFHNLWVVGGEAGDQRADRPVTLRDLLTHTASANTMRPTRTGRSRSSQGRSRASRCASSRARSGDTPRPASTRSGAWSRW